MICVYVILPYITLYIKLINFICFYIMHKFIFTNVLHKNEFLLLSNINVVSSVVIFLRRFILIGNANVFLSKSYICT